MHFRMVEEIARQRRFDLQRRAEAREAVAELPRTPRAERKARRARDAGPRALSLDEIPLFEGLSGRTLSLVGRKADRVSFRAGDVLADEALPRAGVTLIARGAVETRFAGRYRAVLRPGDLFGERTVLEPTPRSVTATALSDGEAFTFGRRDFQAILRSSPAVGVRMLERMAEEIRRTEEDLTTARVVSLDRPTKSVQHV